MSSDTPTAKKGLGWAAVVIGFTISCLFRQERWIKSFESETKQSLNQSSQISMFECRKNLETWLRPQIKGWIQDDHFPILDWVSVEPDGMLRIHFIHNHLDVPEYMPLRRKYFSPNWMCGTDVYNESAPMHKVSKSSQFFLFCNYSSILHHSKMNRTREEQLPINVWLPEVDRLKYDLQPMIDCDTNEQKFGRPKDDISLAMCSVLFGDNWTKMMPSFAEYYSYHKLLGFEHFWVFVNTATHPSQPLPEVDDVTFIPYNYRWKHYGSPNIAYGGVSVWQEAMQNQCLSRLRRYGVDWVTTTDIDEFLDIRNENFRETIYPLRSFLKEYEDNLTMADNTTTKNSIAALKMSSVIFEHNTNIKQTQLPYHMLMENVFRKPGNNTNIFDRSRPKMIYRPGSCDTAGVHWCRRANKGSRVYGLDGFKDIMIHHIRSPFRTTISKPPTEGYWLGKPGTGVWLGKDSGMADTYHLKVCQEMLKGPFTQYLSHLDEAKCKGWSHANMTQNLSSS